MLQPKLARLSVENLVENKKGRKEIGTYIQRGSAIDRHDQRCTGVLRLWVHIIKKFEK